MSQSRRTKSDTDCDKTKQIQNKTKKAENFHDYATIDYGNKYDTHYYIEDKLNDSEFINVNFNKNTAYSNKCACYKHIDASIGSYKQFHASERNYKQFHAQSGKFDAEATEYAYNKHIDASIENYKQFDAEATELLPTGELQNSFLTVVDNNCNSLPKTRTRIKTNPWLPSPRTTPTPSVTSSMTSSMTSSPDDFPLDGGKSFDPEADADVYEYNSLGRAVPLNTLNRISHPIREQHGSAVGQSEYNVMQRSFTSDTDNEFSQMAPNYEKFQADLAGNLGTTSYSFQPHHSLATNKPQHSSVEQLNSATVGIATQTKQDLEPTNLCNFDYEEVFESQIGKSCLPSKCLFTLSVCVC